jgi:hypothetical protein
MEKEGKTMAIEIKASKKINSAMISGLKYWQKNYPSGQCLLIYGGEKDAEPGEGMHAINWKKVTEV